MLFRSSRWTHIQATLPKNESALMNIEATAGRDSSPSGRNQSASGRRRSIRVRRLILRGPLARQQALILALHHRIALADTLFEPGAIAYGDAAAAAFYQVIFLELA